MSEQPLDSLRLLVGKKVLVKCRGGRELRATLHGYDEHLNMVLGGAEESQPSETKGKDPKTRMLEMSYMRGDQVSMVSRIE